MSEQESTPAELEGVLGLALERADSRGWLADWPLLLLPAVPTLTTLIEMGRLPRTAREWVADCALSAVLVWLAVRVRGQRGRLEKLAQHDELTGCFNRLRFEHDLRREIRRVRRLGLHLTLGVIDVNDLKQVNDTDGHRAGDALLRLIADTLTGTIRRATDRCYRIGGDEFALLLVSRTADDAQAVVDRISRLGSADIGAFSYASGFATCDEEDGPAQLLERADRRMYAAKHEMKPQPR